MKLSHGLAVVALASAATAAQAEDVIAEAAPQSQLTATVTATTDYDFRGITQTAQKPALQGSIDYSHASGFYVGVWGSNVDFGNCCSENIETDFYGGWRGGSTIAYDLGFINYTYPGAHDLAYPEIYASATYKWLMAKVWYSWTFAQSHQSAEYYQVDANVPLVENLTLGLHTGYSDGDYWGKDNYFDWSAGLTYTLSHFSFNLKWVDGSDLKIANNTHNDVASSDARAIFSVSTTFPWSK